MADMNLPGTHIESCLEELEFKVQQCRDEARRNSILADAYEESARKFRRALSEEAKKLKLADRAPPAESTGEQS